jgi:hypothetical protein
MNRLLISLVLMLGCSIHVVAQEAGDVNNGKIWNADSRQWQGIEAFWLEYAQGRGGLTWGRSSEYPPYNEVKEFDTLMIELEQGPCLMEFFHQRWRRANDVRRWNDAVNDFGGCPYVFD